MATEFSDCPNCGSKLKSGLLSNVSLLSDNKTKIINENNENKSIAYCNKCGSDLYLKYKSKLIDEQDKISRNMHKLITAISVVSTQSPLNWDYHILSMVTRQSTTGTGVISEFTSSFTDLFGAQSERFNKKLKSGEELCFAPIAKTSTRLRWKCSYNN